MELRDSRMVSRFKEFRVLLRERIEGVRTITEREVMEAADGVAKIVELAQAAMDGAMELARHVGAEGSASEASGISRQLALLAEHQRVLGAHVQRQEELTAQTLAHARSIRTASTNIARLTVESRVLALNARIEAGRAAAGSRGFAVVATEMQRLSAEIATANTRIQELAVGLDASVPELAKSAGELRGYMETFSVEIEGSISRIRLETSSLDGAAKRVASSSKESLNEVISASYGVLSHLQFQDVVAQSLSRLDARFSELQRECADSFGMTELAADVSGESREPIRSNEHDVAADVAVGEVMLF